MTNEDRQMLITYFIGLDGRLKNIEQQLFNKMKVARIIDISDDKVHIAKKIVNMWETPDGVIIHIK